MVLEARGRYWVLGSWLAIVAATGCTGADDSRSPTASVPPETSVTEQPNGQTRQLALAPRDHQAYLVEALDPPTHTFEVRLVLEPSARVSLWFLTHYGQRLDLVRSSTTDEGCLDQSDRIVCLQEFPALEAQRAGAWTLHIRNMSGHGTTAEITVTFTPL